MNPIQTYIYIWIDFSESISDFSFHQTINGICAKNLEVTLLFRDLSKAFDSILLAYSLPKETVTTIKILYKSTTIMILYDNTNFFVIVTGLLQRDTLALYMFIICLDYILWTSINLIKENVLKTKKNSDYNTLHMETLLLNPSSSTLT